MYKIVNIKPGDRDPKNIGEDYCMPNLENMMSWFVVQH